MTENRSVKGKLRSCHVNIMSADLAQDLIYHTSRCHGVGVQEHPGNGVEQSGSEVGVAKQLTPMAENNVIPIEPKYAAVKGSRGSEIRCLT